MNTPELAQQVQKLLGLLSTELSEQLESSITTAVEQLRAVKGDEQLEKTIVHGLEAKLGDLVGAWSEYATTVSAEYLEQMSEATGGNVGQQLYTQDAGNYVSRLDKIASIYSAQPASFWADMSGVERQRLVQRLKSESLQTGNDFIARVASKKGERCAIVTRGKTCAFCTMLASRGYVYHVQHMPHLHDDCNCVLMPRSYGEHIGYDYSSAWHQYRVARSLWRANKKESPTDNDITQLMRHLYREKYRDIPTAPGKVKTYGDGSLNELAYSRFLRASAEKYLDLKDAGALPAHAKLPPLTPFTVSGKFAKALEAKGLTLSTKGWNAILFGGFNTEKGELSGGHLYGYGWINGGNSEFEKGFNPRKISQLLLKTVSGENLTAGNVNQLRKEINGITYILEHEAGKVLSFSPLGN